MTPQSPEVSRLAVAMADSYRRLAGHDLVEGSDIATAVYNSADMLLCHDGSEDPRFVYANQVAQDVFGRPWSEFVGMPSRLSAATDVQAERGKLIAQATESGYVTGYSGIRVSSSGSKFRILDATLWRVTDADGEVLGLACRIPRWEYEDV